MSKIIQKAKLCRRIIKNICTLKGSFTISDVIKETQLPRSTVTDWVNRLVEEGIIKKNSCKSWGWRGKNDIAKDKTGDSYMQ